MKKVAVFGVGISGRAIYRNLRDKDEIEIVGFIDNNPSLHGTTFGDVPIFSPGEMLKKEYDKIALGGVWIGSMLSQLERMGVPAAKIWQIPDKDVQFASAQRAAHTDEILETVDRITSKLGMNYYIIGSSLVTLFRNKDLSSVADVDIFLPSQEEAIRFITYVHEKHLFQHFSVKTITYDKEEVIAHKDDIKKFIIQAKVPTEQDEPANVDISIADNLSDKFLVRHGENYIYIPKHMCDGKRYHSYKHLKVQIPFKAEAYLSLLYGENWIEPPVKWDQSDYGNLLTPEEVSGMVHM